jgi:hypothetical protein
MLWTIFHARRFGSGLGNQRCRGLTPLLLPEADLAGGYHVGWFRAKFRTRSVQLSVKSGRDRVAD